MHRKILHPEAVRRLFSLLGGLIRGRIRSTILVALQRMEDRILDRPTNPHRIAGVVVLVLELERYC